ncbi:uncharacterized protein V6R79_001369 [Siganus canaliculatus]
MEGAGVFGSAGMSPQLEITLVKHQRLHVTAGHRCIDEFLRETVKRPPAGAPRSARVSCFVGMLVALLSTSLSQLSSKFSPMRYFE